MRTKFHTVSAASIEMAEVTTTATATIIRGREGAPEGAATTTNAAAVAASKHHMNLFDLANVGLSSTLAIAIFIGIGYVVRHVAGPSSIVSVLIAACIAYLVGKFSETTNCTYNWTNSVFCEYGNIDRHLTLSVVGFKAVAVRSGI